MTRYLMPAIYSLTAPALFIAASPREPFVYGLAITALVAGLLVSLVHLRQQTTGGQVMVGLGTALACLGGFAAWAMLALLLAFAGDSGQHIETIGNIGIAVALAILLLSPPLGALAGAGLHRLLSSRKAPAEKPAEPQESSSEA